MEPMNTKKKKKRRKKSGVINKKKIKKWTRHQTKKTFKTDESDRKSKA